jgi:ABC-type spermidine/putrescine transport system permease subunit II
MWCFVLGVYAFLYAPILVMAAFSFNDGRALTLPFAGFSTRWYEALAEDNQMQDALLYSLRVAVVAVALSCAFGLCFALLFRRRGFRGVGVAKALVVVPLALPGVMLGISLLVLFRNLDIANGFFTIVAGHVAFITPIVTFIVLQRLESMDSTLEDASNDLGGGPLQTFWHVTLPASRLALTAAALLGFTISFDEVTVSLFLAGTDATLPVHVWGLLRFGFTPEVNAVFTVIAVVSIVLIGAAAALASRSAGEAS